MHNKPEFYSSGYYDFHRYFFPLYLINPLNRYIEKMLWELDLIIIISMIFFVPSSIFLVTRLRRIFTPPAIYRPHIGLLVGGVFSLFMLSSVSSFLWDWLPVLPKIQFPWRWLIVATAFGPVCLVVLLSDLAKFANRRVLVYAAAAFTMILILYSVTQNILQSNPLSREVFTRQVSEMDSTEACSCWWPVWATSAAKDQHEQVASGARPVTIEKWSAADRSFSVDSGKRSNATVATFWYPYWHDVAPALERAVSEASFSPLQTLLSDYQLWGVANINGQNLASQFIVLGAIGGIAAAKTRGWRLPVFLIGSAILFKAQSGIALLGGFVLMQGWEAFRTRSGRPLLPVATHFPMPLTAVPAHMRCRRRWP